MKNEKNRVITFKADAQLSEALQKIPNRSLFIRAAVTAALASTCPLCGGAGFLSPSQKEHWDSFARHHSVEECTDCHETYLACRRPRKR